MLAGKHHGKIKAMHDERNIVTVAVLQLGIWVLMVQQLQVISSIFLKTKRSKNCVKRSQLMREQSVRTQRHITWMKWT
jgi:translation initiation factor IF-2